MRKPAIVGILFVCSLLMMIFIPTNVSAIVPISHVNSLSLYDNTTLVFQTENAFDTKFFSTNVTISSVVTQATFGPLVNVSFYGTDWVLYYPDETEAITDGSEGTYEIQLGYILIDGVLYRQYTFYWNLTTPFNMTIHNEYYRFTIYFLAEIDGVDYTDSWSINLMVYVPGEVSLVKSYGIGNEIAYITWILVIFLPSLLLGIASPKIGFIAGLTLTSIALTFGGVMVMWLFVIIVIGIIVLIIRGDES